ncbi:MAG: M16 family metallopeptidase [Gemmatimonadaceae bacterium]
MHSQRSGMAALLGASLAIAFGGALGGALGAQARPASKAPKTVAPTAVQVTPGPRDVLPFRATEATLDNGLRVIVVPTGFPNLVSIQVPVQTGSRNEVEPGKSGFAHFFEHMMFRGTPNFSPERFNAVMTAAGARNNAYTTDDYTNYYATFAKENLAQIVEMMGDQFQHLAYAEPEFKTEARAVLGEYNKNSASPFFKLFEATRQAAFSRHPYGHTTMGFIRDIEDMPNQYAYSRQFFDRWYRPEYTTVIVAGDVTPGEVIPLVQKYWGSWKRGSYRARIPAEPAPKGPKYVHVDWTSPTSPLITVAFRNPAFSEVRPDNAAMDMVANLWFGETSELYKELVIRDQKVDFIGGDNTSNADPELFTVTARVKKAEDVAHVRDRILATVARARTELVPAADLADAKANARYSFVRRLDNTDAIASTLARFVRYRRSYGTINAAYRLYDVLTPQLLRAAARYYLTDSSMVIATLSNGALPAEAAGTPSIASRATAMAPAGASSRDSDSTRRALAVRLEAYIDRTMAIARPLVTGGRLPPIETVTQQSPLPQLEVKLLFAVGSAADPQGKEGLAALSGAMIAEAGSRIFTRPEIQRLLYPMAGGFGDQVDKEMTTFTGSIHKDNWHEFLHIVLPQLTDPGFREEDFRRLKDAQKVALTQGLRTNNEEELGKERLQQNIFAGTPYAHPVLGTEAGIDAITLDDVKQFAKAHYTRAALTMGLSGDIPEGMDHVLRAMLAELPEGTPPGPRTAIAGRRPQGMEVEIIQKETRATAISLGLPIPVTRAHPDFAALNVARAWLGEHRSSMSHLYQRIREVRGMNYGDYAYIEAFPRGMFGFFPAPNIARRAQLFEVWIRPVVPENAHMALRIATHELQQLIEKGMSAQEFASTRDYLMKNAYLVTATQDQQLGAALDSKWYGIGEYAPYMREQLAKLTVDDVNTAIRKYLSATDLSVVIITKDAEKLKQQLLSEAFSPIAYDGAKPAELLAEDQVIGARTLHIAPEKIRITPVSEVFAR